MAMFNEIQVGRFNALLHKLLDMKEGAPAPQLGGDLVPTLALEADRPEWAFLAGVRRCVGAAQQTGVAAQNSQILLSNPTSSGVLIVLEQAVISTGSGGGPITAHQVLGSFATSVGTKGVLDSRWGWGATGGLVVTGVIERETSGAALGAEIAQTTLVNATNLGNWPVFVLSPGNGIAFRNGTVNNTLTAMFFWHERQLELSETR